MKKDTFRIVTRGADGQLRIKDYGDKEALLELHTQIGVDDCNTDLDLRGMPVFRGLIGPMSEDKTVVRYETPDVFEALTKEWCAQPAEKKRRRRRKPVADAEQAKEAAAPQAATLHSDKAPEAKPAEEVTSSIAPVADVMPVTAPTPVANAMPVTDIAPVTDATRIDAGTNETV